MINIFSSFSFDNIASDEYGVICVSIDNSNIGDFVAQESDINTEKSMQSMYFNIISQNYSQPLTYTIKIANRNFEPFTSMQERIIKKWLCKRNTYSLFSIYDKRYSDIYFFANFNNPKNIWFNDVNVLEFSVVTNSPVAYSEEKNVFLSFDGEKSLSLYIDNDEDLPIYPDMIMVPKTGGTLIITGMDDNNKSIISFQIKNVSANEIIIVDSKYPLLETSHNAHLIYNDFNKEWFHFIDGYNIVSTNIACDITFKYREYRKVGLL